LILLRSFLALFGWHLQTLLAMSSQGLPLAEARKARVRSREKKVKILVAMGHLC